MERISSRRNPIVKQFRTVADEPTDRLLLDGAHLLDEALASGIKIDVVALRETLTGGPLRELVRRAEDQGARVLSVTDGVLAAISPVSHPSGIVAIAHRRMGT